MSLLQSAKAVYEQWTAAYDKLIKELPTSESVLTTEEDKAEPEIKYLEEQELLFCCARISKQIVHNDGSICMPRWVLLGKGEYIKWPLKIIITGPTKQLYLAFKGDCKIEAVKILGTTRSKKALLGELVL